MRFPAWPPHTGKLYEVSVAFSPEHQLGSSAEPVQPHHSLNSLNSVSECDQTSSDQVEAQILATSAARRILVVSWQDVKTAAISDKPYADLLDDLHSDSEAWNDSLVEYRKYRIGRI